MIDKSPARVAALSVTPFNVPDNPLPNSSSKLLESFATAAIIGAVWAAICVTASINCGLRLAACATEVVSSGLLEAMRSIGLASWLWFATSSSNSGFRAATWATACINCGFCVTMRVSSGLAAAALVIDVTRLGLCVTAARS